MPNEFDLQGMIRFSISIKETKGGPSISFQQDSKQATELEIAVLKSECSLGFARNAEAVRRLAEAVLKGLREERQ
jgi:hypothetical protein